MGITSVVVGLAVLVAAAWFVQTTAALRLDRSAIEVLLPLRGTAVDSFFIWLRAVVRPVTLAPVSLIIALLLWWKLRRLAFLVPLSFAVSIAMTYAVKWVVGKPRPGQGLSLVDAHDAAFPSAHVAGIASTGMALWSVLAPMLRRTAKKLLRIAVVALIGVMALARVWVGAHWLTDVLGGLVVAVIGLSIAMLVLRFLSRQRRLVAP